MTRRAAVALFCIFLGACSHASPQGSTPPASAVFDRTTPEEQGVSSAALLSFLEAADKIDAMNSVMIVRHGHVVAEGWWAPYGADSNHELYSLSKSFTSTAVGFAIAEGKLSLDDEVLKIFPEDAPPEPSANLKAMRIRDLITMSAGHQDETSSAADKITPKSFLAHPVPHKPGTHFKYNTPATFMLSAAVQKRTGQTLAEYLKPRLFDPLGITRPVWNTNAQGIALGGYGLRVRTEDIARFGHLYLQKGQWQGKQLLPKEWVELATSRQVSNGSNPKSDWEQGYGFQFWRCRHGAYRGDGAFGQYCVVLPEQDAVIAITSGLKDMQAVLNLIWDKVLPGMQSGPLAASPEAAALRERLKGLRVKTVEGAATSTHPLGRKYGFPANDAKLESLVLAADGLTLRLNGKDTTIPCGSQTWTAGKGSYGAYQDEPAAACGAWTGETTYVAKEVFIETPFYLTATLDFAGDEVRCTLETNV
ncbi:MAG: serine hydrolase, partial [Planctomycetaceae bacterium]|nr:serine hydrolase [Planctomycetaceae bacterium]